MMMVMEHINMNIYVRLTGRLPRGRGEKERVLRGEEDGCMLHVYIRQYHETHQIMLEKGRKSEKTNENIMVNLFKV
jgi:hypothetical protein